jgi:hypothetical protein
MNEFCVFIISYKRPDRVLTYKTLRKQGYTGKIYIIVGSDDNMVDEYKKKFKDEVIVFNKNDYDIDLVDNEFNDKITGSFARVASYDIAKKLGYKYFLLLDDDYEGFYFMCDSKGRFKHLKIKNLDKVFDIFFEFYKNCENISYLSFGQMGDFIGGKSTFDEFIFGKRGRMVRKSMNVFFSSVDRKVKWVGRLNEDVNTFLYWGMKGKIFLTNFLISVLQKLTQTNPGGLSESYKSRGTYWKSFSSIIINPVAVKISVMGVVEKRIHHNVLWEYAVPYILPDKFK